MLRERGAEPERRRSKVHLSRNLRGLLSASECHDLRSLLFGRSSCNQSELVIQYAES